MAANLDMEERLRAAFTELLAADSDIAAIVEDRIWWFGDATHKAKYPCILFNLPDATVSGLMELGWYEMHLQILGAVFRPDDKDGAVLRKLEGLIRGFCQQKDLPALLTDTYAAKRRNHALTVVDARIENDVADEEGQQQQIYAGTTLVVICAPFNENEVKPHPTAGTVEEGQGSGTEEPIENNQPTGD